MGTGTFARPHMGTGTFARPHGHVRSVWVAHTDVPDEEEERGREQGDGGLLAGADDRQELAVEEPAKARDCDDEVEEEEVLEV
jgi:hypothetical protein